MLLYLKIFIVAGLLGWLLDTAYRTLDAKRYTSGTIVPFFSIIYGIVAVELYILFSFWALPVYLHIIIGTLLTILSELVSGLLGFKILKRRVWDYRSSRFHYKGFIDIEHSFYWLILTALCRIFYSWLF